MGYAIPISEIKTMINELKTQTASTAKTQSSVKNVRTYYYYYSK